jgi:hypothetical protein
MGDKGDKHPAWLHPFPCGCEECVARLSKTNHIDFTTPKKSPQEKMREYNRRYREKNNGDMTCECGAVIKQISHYTHLRSKKHEIWRKTNE